MTPTRDRKAEANYLREARKISIRLKEIEAERKAKKGKGR